MLNTNTAVGIDQWSPAQLRALSPEAKELLLNILQDIEKTRAWPGYTYYNIIVLMGKPNGGVRPIALMAMIYRLWTKIRRPYIVQWERAHAGPWDAAIKGSSARRAGMLSALNDERAAVLGDYTLSVLFDMEKFYDNIDILKLIDLADEQQYPQLVLQLGLQIHIASRGLRCYQHCPGQIQPNHGIIAGCTQSTTFAKVYLNVVLQDL